MSSAWRGTGSIVLSCGHSIKISLPLPAVGEIQYCRCCNEYMTVKESAPAYTVKCLTGRCTLNRYVGADRDQAFEVARRHVQKMARHKVVIKNGLLSVAELTNVEETLFVTEEERKVSSAESQKSLRNLGQGSIAA